MSKVLKEILDELRKPTDSLWQEKDIAAYYGTTPSSIRRATCKPDFPKAIKPQGLSRRWKPSEVKEWFDRQRENAA